MAHAGGSRRDAYYRTSDPVDKLKVKVTIRETSRVIGTGNKRKGPFSKEFVLGWQEKLYGPGDIATYIKHRDLKTKPKTAVEQDSFRYLSLLESEGSNVGDLLEDVMLYTYTDREHHTPETAPPLMDPTGTEPYLGAAISGAWAPTHTFPSVTSLPSHPPNPHPTPPQTQPTGSGMAVDNEGTLADARQRKVRQRVFKEKPFKVMHVCLATDVDVVRLRDEKPWAPEHYFKEHVLFSLRVYNDGLLEMAPEFSRVMDEDDSRLASSANEGGAPSVFLTNKTVAAGIKKGMRLTSYRLRSEDGSEYEYALENVNQCIEPAQLEAARVAAIINDAFKAQAVRGEGAWRMDPPAPGRDETLTYYAEIVSGTGFEGETLFVSYHVSLPPDWVLRTGDLVDGLSEEKLKGLARGEGGNKQLSMLASTALDMDGHEDGLTARGALQGTTQTARARTSRGDILLPSLRPLWKGKSLPYAFDGLSRLVWGLSFFLLTVIAIVVGVEYPLWLIPCLVFTFGLGTGYPGGTTQVCLRDKNSPQGRRESRGGVGRKRLVGPQVSLPTASFNHLVNLSCDRCRSATDEAVATTMPSAAQPTMVFEVYSVGLFGRVRLEGYGYHHLPTTPGPCDVTVRTWRPMGGIGSKMADFFLGSSLRLHDPRFVDMPASLKLQRQTVGAGLARRAQHTAVLNRLGVSSETSGELRLRCHVIQSSPDLAASAASFAASAAAGTLSSQGGAGIGAGLTLTRGRSVGDILRSTQRLGASGSLATLSPSLSGLGLGLGSSVGASGSVSGGGQTPSGREADSAALSRRAEQLLAQAKSKVAALSALSSSSSASAGAKGESKEYGLPSASAFSSSSLAESKEQGLGLSLGLRSGAVAGAGRRGAKARYSDDEGEGDGEEGEKTGLLRR